MAKVILIWNEHPTEVVAGFHARKVARILREKYGHEVVLEKVPVAETNYGIVSGIKSKDSARKTLDALAKLKPSIARAAQAAQRHRAVAFNFHASNDTCMGNATHLAPEDFSVELSRLEDKKRQWYKKEVFIGKQTSDNDYIVEVPAFLMPFENANLAERRLKQILAVAPQLRRLKHQKRNSVMQDLNIVYHTGSTPLRHPAQQKYLHPAISEKIAQAIHERISRK